MITDLFSHKIHSSNDEWQDKLVEIACLFSEFDGLPYDRNEIEQRLISISPRASIVSASTIGRDNERDTSKFRDEISAYPAYLGLYHFELKGDRWIFKLSETAKNLLVVEEPNVPSFMLLQQLLFQYPNGMGAAYSSNSGGLRIQANARDKTLELIKEGIHLSPFRLICKALLADSIINGINSLHPYVTLQEISILANDKRLNRTASPSMEDVSKVLDEARSGALSAPNKFERRFHILNHTDFLQVTNGTVHLRESISPSDQEDLKKKLQAINNTTIQFKGFDNVKNEKDLKDVIYAGSWGRYFDGLLNLSAETVKVLTNDLVQIAPAQAGILLNEVVLPNEDYSQSQFKYDLRPRDEYQAAQPRVNRKKETADPEVTKIKRQRSNLVHKIITQKIDEHLRSLGAIPYESEHIDIFAKIPNDGSFLFEVKSFTPDNLLSQTRKGISQLYEYRYRYMDDVSNDVVLCLVYPKEPSEIDWLQEYLCNDREIAICWFQDDNFKYSPHCADKFQSLLLNK